MAETTIGVSAFKVASIRHHQSIRTVPQFKYVYGRYGVNRKYHPIGPREFDQHMFCIQNLHHCPNLAAGQPAVVDQKGDYGEEFGGAAIDLPWRMECRIQELLSRRFFGFFLRHTGAVISYFCRG